MQHTAAPPRFTLRQSVYALQDPAAPGLYIRIGNDRPRLSRLPQASIAPATKPDLEWLAKRANRGLQGVIYDVVRVDA